MNQKVSIVIPSRNEPHLAKTVNDLLSKAKGDIEIIVILDGWWMSGEDISDDPRVNYLHFSEAKGMRNAINKGVAVAKGDFIMKTDAHCLFSEGYDKVLRESCEENTVVVPRRYALDVEKWKIEERTDGKYPLDYMYLSKDLHGEVWKERDNARKDIMIDDLMSSQGSCWMMRKDYFDYLELMDEETYGIFWNEFQEIGLKAWLSGGRIVVNKNAYYAHWHKTEGRGYSLPKGEKEQIQKMVEKWLSRGKTWHKQVHDVNWLIRKFKPVPTWQDNL